MRSLTARPQVLATHKLRVVRYTPLSPTPKESKQKNTSCKKLNPEQRSSAGGKSVRRAPREHNNPIFSLQRNTAFFLQREAVRSYDTTRRVFDKKNLNTRALVQTAPSSSRGKKKRRGWLVMAQSSILVIDSKTTKGRRVLRLSSENR